MNEATYQLFRGILVLLDICEVLADPLFWLAVICLEIYWSFVVWLSAV